MVTGPVCAKCMVGWGIDQTIKEYHAFIDLLKVKEKEAGAQHLSTLYKARIEVFVDVIDDLTSLIPYLQNEASLRTKANKGT